MSDTQWPRFEVFLQEAPEDPHRHAGSVHAPDAELALLNARDVFVRRPECSSLWVAPASSIVGRTLAEPAEAPSATEVAGGATTEFAVFAKLESRGVLTYQGEVRADSPGRALEEAAGGLARPPFVLWVVPAARMTRSEPDQAAPLFSPALDKPYRDQAFYHIQTALRRLRQGGGG